MSKTFVRESKSLAERNLQILAIFETISQIFLIFNLIDAFSIMFYNYRFLSFFQLNIMEVDAEVGTEQLQDNGYESYMGPLDIILLIFLLGGVTWWFLRSKKKEDVSTGRSYSIQ